MRRNVNRNARDLHNSMASNDDVGVDPAAAKRYKFAVRCEFILVRKRNGRPHKCGMHVRNGIF